MEKDNKEREKLIELIKVMECHPEDTCPREVENCYKCEYIEDKGLCNVFARKADYLLRNNVFVPPCEVGDIVWYINKNPHIALLQNSVYKAEVVRIVKTRLGTSIVIQIKSEGCCEIPDVKYWGITLFPTRKEAEQALVNYKSSKNDNQRKEDEGK